MKKIESINCTDFLAKGNHESFPKSRGTNLHKYGFIITKSCIHVIVCIIFPPLFMISVDDNNRQHCSSYITVNANYVLSRDSIICIPLLNCV